MKYAVVYTYPEDQSKIAEVRPEHRRYLGSLQEQGKLVAAGPFANDVGALIIYEADSEEATSQLIQNDPFHKAGIFAQYTIRAWTKVF
jgi:uncharacterized protein YciI